MMPEQSILVEGIHYVSCTDEEFANGPCIDAERTERVCLLCRHILFSLNLVSNMVQLLSHKNRCGEYRICQSFAFIVKGQPI